jgi:hypothetical protein
METKKIILLASFSMMMLAAQSQPIVENRKGNIRAQGNLAGGYLFKQKQASAYVTGDVDVFVHNNISVTGEAWYNFKLSEKPTGLLNNHSIFWGFNYHFLPKGRLDPYIGFSPGVAIARAGYINSEGMYAESIYGVAPLISAVAGINYYVGSIFNFFVKARWNSGVFHSHVTSPQQLDEMKISAGLGWNFRAWKPKR